MELLGVGGAEGGNAPRAGRSEPYSHQPPIIVAAGAATSRRASSRSTSWTVLWWRTSSEEASWPMVGAPRVGVAVEDQQQLASGRRWPTAVSVTASGRNLVP